MTWLEAVAILVAGVAAGTINAVVGSGSLVTFPTLLAFGYPPVQSSISNTVGLTLGSISGAIGYRAELRGQARRLVRLGIGSMFGAASGGVLLLWLPEETFQAVVPILILVACLLVLVQPKLNGWLAARRGQEHGGVPLFVAIFAASVYGGYFGAAQGVILIALLGIFLQDNLQRLNGAKNVCGAVVNVAAAVLFAFIAPVAWAPAALIAGGSIVGGQIGAHFGRKLPPLALRGVIVVVGIVATVSLVLD